MARIGWYNDNANRDYPLRADAAPGLPQSAIVDVGFLVGLDSSYDDNQHRIYLNSIHRSSGGGTFFFEFKSTAPGLFEKSLTFERSIADEPYETSFEDLLSEPGAEVSSISESDPGDLSCIGDTALWSGFLVTGPLDALKVLLDPGETFVGGESLMIEEATVQVLSDGFVRGIHLANGDRTRVATPEGCKEICWPVDIGSLFVNARCITGAIRFKEGYNCSIRQTSDGLKFSASVGAGAGEPCEEVPLSTHESPPDRSTLLDGAVSCDDILRTINGVAQRSFVIQGGTGVQVSPDPENHRVIVNVDMHGLAACLTETVNVDDEDCDPEEFGPSDCDCGPLAE